MSTAAPHKAKLPDELPRDGRNLLFHGVDWEDFVSKPDHWSSGYRAVYDNGTLELMTVGQDHGRWKKLIARLVEALAEEFDIPCEALGNWTLLRRDLLKGLEPDECYYITNEPKIRGKGKLSLPDVPPPDLALEVDISRWTLKKLSTYAGIGVPEIWRFDEEKLSFLRLSGGRYHPVSRSVAFPFLAPDDLSPFLQALGTRTQTETLKDFRRWVRETLRPRLTSP